MGSESRVIRQRQHQQLKKRASEADIFSSVSGSGKLYYVPVNDFSCRRLRRVSASPEERSVCRRIAWFSGYRSVNL